MTSKPPADHRVPVLRVVIRHRRRLSWVQALGLVAGITALVVLVSAALVTRTDPDRFPDLATGLWWAIATFTTVGYGDVVPASGAGRLLAAAVMLLGIGSFAFLTAVAASAIVIGEEHRIEDEEQEIERVQDLVLARLRAIDERLDRIEKAQQRGMVGKMGAAQPVDPPQRDTERMRDTERLRDTERDTEWTCDTGRMRVTADGPGSTSGGDRPTG
ncbi:potassium channel family protein [Planosporangium sp. 12N6]|uniref:potassium channel family protein n=1 Tax=Planosporangium spinosum TaxID=3402278 RepID=UPI003CFA6B5D